MKQLETQVRKQGFTYELVERTEFTALYSQKCQESGMLVAFEVFRINKNPERVIAGVTIPASESLPSNEQFGTSAYCYSLSGGSLHSALTKAKAKFAELEQQELERQSNAKAKAA